MLDFEKKWDQQNLFKSMQQKTCKYNILKPTISHTHCQIFIKNCALKI